MKKYKKIITGFAAMLAMTLSAAATPVYYTILHALEEDTMDVFTAGGRGSLSVSKDGGESYTTISSFRFDGYGRAVAKVYQLSKIPADSPVVLEASFNEGANGQPVDTVVETTAGEFLDSLMPYKRWSWLAYAPVYVSYENLPTIAELAESAGQFTILLAAAEEAGLSGALTGEGDLTVFAPTDAAFSNLLSSMSIEAADLLADKNLQDILYYHIVGASLDGDAVAAETHIETLLGLDVDVSIVDGKIFINDSEVIIPNLKASNGIIHVIDAVLSPPELPNIVDIAASDDNFETLVLALQETGLDAALTNDGPFTVFAPTDAAFSNLLAGTPLTAADLLADPGLTNILLYHVVDERLDSGDVAALERINTLLGENVKVNVTEDGVFINGAEIVLKDIKASNGIIHVIDMVLIPEEMPSIVDIAVAADDLTILVDALIATDLDEVLSGEGPYTVFAPTNEAFEALPGWLLNFLVNNPKYLTQVLLYHVVPGDLDASEVLEQGTLDTAQGRSVKAQVKDGEVFINKSKVIDPNIEAENGTIHVIDRVLIPWFRY